ncbi:MAG: histidine--tRNA ligase [Candidatus Nitrosopolaris wilkensis]|nr:MAG: histidine--tRNA ligase [Candidatus Nitrosopolaris wilkensis]
MKLELPRGMRDLESDELLGITYIKEKFFETTRLFNFKSIEPSPVEMLATLEAKAGPTISNDIYSFTDKGGRNIALRFDLTIGLTRFIASRRDLKMPAKIAAFAGVWRYDEPQAARYRYFHQWDIEIYGSFSFESDAEVIEFVSIFLKKLGLKVIIEINDLQLTEQYIQRVLGVYDKKIIREMLRALDKVPKKGLEEVLKEYSSTIDSTQLCSILDLSRIKGSLEEVKSNLETKGLISWRNLEELMDSLKSRKVNDTRINLGVVRGLDYYSGIVFEALDPLVDVGALVGGGRYDILTDAFGRKDVGASGAAGGVERIALAMQKRGLLEPLKTPIVYVAHTSLSVRKHVLEIVSDLRKSGIYTDYDIQGRSIRRQLEDAYTKNSLLIVLVVQGEIENGLVTLKDLKDHTETILNVNHLQEAVCRVFQHGN